MEALKTDCERRKEARDMAIYNDWNELISKPGAMAEAIYIFLGNKHEVSRSRIYSARKRVEERLKILNTPQTPEGAF